MLKRIFALLISFTFICAIAAGMLSCASVGQPKLTVLTDVKGIPDKVENSIGKNENDNTTGEDGTSEDKENGSGALSEEDIILNKSSNKIHLSKECRYASSIKESNKLVKPRSELESYLENGYTVCSNCNKNYQNGN